jgi:hypothetical protein
MPLADRRLASRFEIVGKPWAFVETREPLRVRNVSREGMLVESETPLAVGSVHEFQMITGATTARIRAAVRHLSPPGPTGAGQRYLVGLEFLSLDPQTSALVQAILHKQPPQLYQRGA